MSSPAITRLVTACPQPAFTARKSAPVSPTVVDITLMTQNEIVMAGTLLSQSVCDPLKSVVSMGCPCVDLPEDLTDPT